MLRVVPGKAVEPNENAESNKKIKVVQILRYHWIIWFWEWNILCYVEVGLFYSTEWIAVPAEKLESKWNNSS